VTVASASPTATGSPPTTRSRTSRSAIATTGAPRTLGHRISGALYRRPRLRLALLLGPPLLWIGVVYLGSLAALILQSFYRYDDFSGTVDESLTLHTWSQIFTRLTFDTTVRTAGMAAAVTVACAVIAYPIALFMARHASPRLRSVLLVAVIVPLWSSYLVRVYSWKLILAQEGVLSWFTDKSGTTFLVDWVLDLPRIGGPSLATSLAGQFIVFVYIWLPYMILPLTAGLERVPESYLEASADLGAHPRTTFWRVVWPLGLPGLVAGSIFTFSLTLGDYIIPTIIGSSQPTLGKLIYDYQGTAGNLPLAAALTVIPMAVMAAYLLTARRMGAFEAL
jgi:putative spermidine/putrescine transport system permease protein